MDELFHDVLLTFKESASSYIDAEGNRQYEIVLETEGFSFSFSTTLTDPDPEVIKDQAECDAYVRGNLLANIGTYTLLPLCYHEDYKRGSYAVYEYKNGIYCIRACEYHIDYEDWLDSLVNEFCQQLAAKLKEW